MKTYIEILKVTKDKKKFIVLTNNGEYKFDEETIIKHLILKGKTFSDDEFEEILKTEEISKLFNKALNYISYQMRSENEALDNGWATIPHFLSHPAYYQNYFRATIIKAQMYNYLVSKLGNLTENKSTAKILSEELFKYGMSLEENELIKKLTGKNLSVDDFLKSLKLQK